MEGDGFPQDGLRIRESLRFNKKVAQPVAREQRRLLLRSMSAAMGVYALPEESLGLVEVTSLVRDTGEFPQCSERYDVVRALDAAAPFQSFAKQ